MKKFTRIIAAVMAAATIAVTTSVCASARTLVTGEEITEDLIDRCATCFKSIKISSDQLILTSYYYGFYAIDEKGIMDCNKDYEGAWIDYWATKQKAKVRQHREAGGGELSLLDQHSTG